MAGIKKDDTYELIAEWLDEYNSGMKKFRELEKEGEEHQIEKVGKELRSKFTWVDDSNKIINRAKN